MNKFFEHSFMPFYGYMDMHQSMSLGPHAHMEISRKTPVIDHLEGFPQFYQELVQDIQTHTTVDLFAIGKSGIGKGAVIEESQRKLAEDRDLRKFIIRHGQKNGLTQQYYSLATEFQDAVQEVGVVSPWGPFTPEQLAEGAEKAAQLGHAKLDKAEKDAPKPLLRGLDFITVAAPIDLGSSHLLRAIQRAQVDESYTYRVVAVKTDPHVQERTLHDRQSLWELPQNAQRRDIQEILKRSKVKPDDASLDVDSIRRSYGHPIGLQMVNDLIHSQIVMRQEEIREKVSTALPHITDATQLDKDPQLLGLAEDMYYRLLLFHDWKADPTRVLIVPNTFLDRQIPFYTRRTKGYRIH